MNKLKHHNFFLLHYPTNRDYSKVELNDIIIEDFYLYSNGSMTPTYKPENSRNNFLTITLYPSTIYLSRKFNKESEQIDFINKNINAEFIRVCLRISPIHRILQFIEYHFQKFQGDPEEFIHHIKYVILPRIKRFAKKDKEELIDYESIILVFQEWIDKKKKTVKTPNYQTNIGKAKNIIINNESSISEQFTSKKKSGLTKKNKNIIAILSLIVSLIMLLMAYISNSEVVNRFLGY